jgi:protein-S-isoprenylcysteine O-methyltransferase Ste14
MVNIRTPVEHGYQVKTACTKGPFAYFKHPTYVAMVGCSLSTVLTFNSACKFIPISPKSTVSHCRSSSTGCLVSPVLLSLYLFGILVPREEKYMKDYFGADYVKYTER